MHVCSRIVKVDSTKLTVIISSKDRATPPLSSGINFQVAGNEIELGMMIPMIESRASNIPMTKGITYVVMRFDR